MLYKVWHFNCDKFVAKLTADIRVNIFFRAESNRKVFPGALCGVSQGLWKVRVENEHRTIMHRTVGLLSTVLGVRQSLTTLQRKLTSICFIHDLVLSVMSKTNHRWKVKHWPASDFRALPCDLVLSPQWTGAMSSLVQTSTYPVYHLAL